MYQKTLDYLKEHGMVAPKIGLILGSGLGDLAEEIVNPVKIPYEQIPDFPVSTVEGHAGQLVYGSLAGQKVIALQGRFHYYEGYDLETVTYPIRIFKELGVKSLILTNAAGGVNTSFKPGDLMVISDQLNFTGENPLIGKNNSQGPRFVDMSQTYSKRGIELLHQTAKDLGFHLQEGVYAWMTGPSYETPAEIKAIRLMGGDAVGMSTVPEAIVAKHCGLEVLGVSCITNFASGMQETLNHEEVMAISKEVKPRFKQLIYQVIEQL
ncbi:purine-nucleoside phosphorylase [Facklamia miroungae]|uniref:Purine nucleoside phosphorylase n=1 Tax=Facklamia miroungae TaxID=120956 RepID=A0A1G7PPM8_9LACT|nr:purine-nucleoside phosphorylase [Facklamia miroungae]NKZ28761.1 purine-nucleoside phosphorylase [Facklamia miroungae]SDF87390.1 purine-nucleoside phosphorylase [Facklamia miroungae]